MTRPVVVFDGRCGFCTWSVDFARRRVRANAEFVPYQSSDLDRLGMTREQCEREVQWVQGQYIVGGSSAIAEILQSGDRWWPFIGRVLDRPMVRPTAQRMYEVIARHRGRLWGITPAVSDESSDQREEPEVN